MRGVVTALLSSSLFACSDYDLQQQADPPETELDTDVPSDVVPDDGGDDTDIVIDDGTIGLPPDAAQAEMYAHTGGDLYAISPESPYGRTLVGSFKDSFGFPVFEITDLAINSAGEMYAVSFDNFYKVDPNTARVTKISSPAVDYLNALTFLADGTLLAGGGTAVYEVNVANGAFTPVDSIGTWEFAGDMVGLPDGLLYCSMAPVDGSQSSLVVVNLETQEVVRSGATGTGSLFGVAYAEGKLFGFEENGRIFDINPTTGAATALVNNGPSWYGAATNPALWD